MKKSIFFMVIGGLFALSCTDKNNLFVSGAVEGVESGTIYLQKFVNKMYYVIDSTSVKDGKFQFQRRAEIPEIYGLTLDTTQSSYMLFLDENPATVSFDTAHRYKNTVVEGSALQDLFTEYKQQRVENIDEFINEHPTSLVSAYALYRDFSYRLTTDEILSNISLLDSSLWNTQYVKVLNELVKTLEVVKPGKPAPDFMLDTPAGTPVKLSDKIGKAYLLIDFWAAWCGPCRRENPHIVAAYNKYKHKGFDIIGVSLDYSKEAWEKAILKDSLTWTHVSDLKYWNSKAAQLYGVRSIPSNYLVDKEGIIVEKNLRGEKLDEWLGKHLEDN
jgi:peroxiredoxin